MANKKRVLIALITDQMIHHKVVGTLCQILLANTNYKIDTYVSAMRGIGEHRNVVVKEFLKGDYDYLLFIDADNPPPVNVLDLIEEDKPVIGLPTPIQMSAIQGLEEFYWNVYDNDYPRKNKGDGLEQVYMVGSGVMLIRRDVLESLENPFTEVRDETGLRIVGTDMAFCKKCKEQNIDIYTHWDYKCSHFKEINLLNII